MLLAAGLDALHISTKDGTEQDSVVKGLYASEFEIQRERGNDVHSVFTERTERRGCGSVSVGARDGNSFYQFRAECAERTAEELKRSGIPYRVSRADWAVTFRSPQSEEATARRYRELGDRVSSELGRSRPAHTESYQNPTLSNTYYIGTSDRESYFRTYNKSREPGSIFPPNTWRHEWQVRGKRAQHTWQMFQAAASQDVLALSLVKGFLLQYDADEPWLNELPPLRAVKGKHISDTEKRLQWWISSVAPCCAKLLAAGITIETLVCMLKAPTGSPLDLFGSDSLEGKGEKIDAADRQRGIPCQHTDTLFGME